MSEHPEDELPPDFRDELLDRTGAAAYLASIGVKRTRGTLAKLKVEGRGPPIRRLGRTPYYPKKALHQWAMAELSKVRRQRPR